LKQGYEKQFSIQHSEHKNGSATATGSTNHANFATKAQLNTGGSVVEIHSKAARRAVHHGVLKEHCPHAPPPCWRQFARLIRLGRMTSIPGLCTDTTRRNKRRWGLKFPFIDNTMLQYRLCALCAFWTLQIAMFKFADKTCEGLRLSPLDRLFALASDKIRASVRRRPRSRLIYKKKVCLSVSQCLGVEIPWKP
jgi:hypothetical protein